MKKIFVIGLFGLCLRENAAFGGVTAISDSLVNNLSCNTLSIGNILEKIRPEAFSFNNHLPLRNWGFRSGVTNLAACWGMGSTQRKLFYLMRLNEKGSAPPNTKNVLDMIRGATVESGFVLQSNTDIERAREQALKAYNVIPVTERNLREEYARNTGTSFLEALFKGVDYNLDSRAMHRDLKTEIERSQELHFFRAQNIDMGLGSGPRSPDINQKTLQTLKNNIRLNRLTLINLRLRMTVQHIVIPKSFSQDAKGNVWIQAYDSNQPEADHKIYYSKATGHFYSPEIMGSFIGDNAGIDYSHPLGVFIVDEPERAQIETALLKHYQKRCQ
jgi:hypothetical protein